LNIQFGSIKYQYIGLFLLVILLSFIGLFVKNDYYLNVFVLIGIQAIAVLGLSLLMGYAGQVSLGHAAFYGLGAYASGILTLHYGFNPYLAMLCGIAISAVMALIVGLPALRLKGHYLAMATLGFGIIINICFKEMASLTGGPSGLVGIPMLKLFNFTFDTSISYFCLVWAVFIILMLLSIHLVNSPFGRAFRALGSNEAAAQAMGVNTHIAKLIVFIISAIYASLAGSLYAHFVTFISPASFGFICSIKMVTMVAIGGMGTLWGALLGTSILVSLPEFLTVFSDYDVLVYGLILIVVMIFMPEGIIQGSLKLFRRFRYKETNV